MPIFALLPILSICEKPEYYMSQEVASTSLNLSSFFCFEFSIGSRYFAEKIELSEPLLFVFPIGTDIRSTITD